jgi:protein TonB
LSELINKIKTQINNILDFKVGELSLRDSLSQIDSRASAVPIAAVITVFLFLVMQALVTSNEFDLGDEGASINISFLRQLQDTETQTAKKKPNRPEQEMNSESVSTPDFGGPQFGAFSASTDADVLPIVKVPPQYPRRATQRGIEGWVLVEFTITETGAVINPVVIDADPPGIFNRSAMRTIVKWKYKPRIVGGKAVSRSGVQHLITYELEN